MKNAILICLVLALFSTSCNKNEDKDIETNSVDSSLYISYTVRGIHSKQIQNLASTNFMATNYLVFNEEIIWSIRNSFGFGNLTDIYHPKIALTFWDTLLTQIDYPGTNDFQIRIKEKYKFTTANFFIEEYERKISDTVFLVGTSIGLLDANSTAHDPYFTTQYLLQHYNFDPNIFQSSIFQNSFLKIDSSRMLLNGQIIIAGTFSTVIMNSPDDLSQPDTLSIKGSFRLMTKK